MSAVCEGETELSGTIWRRTVIKMIRAILFDLDNTLLNNEMGIFIPQYLDLIGDFFRNEMDPERFKNELLIGTQAMISNMDRTRTNQEVFWDVFEGRTGVDYATLEPLLNIFYRDRFGLLQPHTSPCKAAPEIVQFCIAQSWSVVIATNPLFPLSAIEQRLEWALLPAAQIDFALITSYENMHAAKPHSEYYQEIVDRIGCLPDEVFMLGDDWENDIVPASKLGIPTFWLTSEGKSAPEHVERLMGLGSLEAFYGLLKSGNMDMIISAN